MKKEISGIPIREKIEKNLTNEIKNLKEKEIVPKLATIRVGADSGQIFYEKAITKRSEKYGISCDNFIFEEGIMENEVEGLIIRLNEDENIHGIIILMPLPRYLDQKKLSNMINPDKDIDAITDVSYSKLLSAEDKGNTFFACTAEACMEILYNSSEEVKGKKVTIFGRSLRVGKPLALMMMNDDATITVCHTKSKEEDAILAAKNADIIVLATGNTSGYDRRYFRDGQIVIDVGTGKGKDGKIAGDLDIEDISSAGIDISYTPVPGGVGAVTTTLLLRNVVKAAKMKIYR